MTASHRLRLLVDLTWLLPAGVGGGIKPALLEVLRWLGRQQAQQLQFIYVTNPGTRAEVMELARPEDVAIGNAEITADLAMRQNCDVVYCPFGITDFACPGIPTITLIVDLLHCDFPASLSEAERVDRERQFQTALAVTDSFQVISDYTAARLHECYAVPAARIFRTHLPVHLRLTGSEPKGKPTLARDRPFFFYPANTWAHKNHETLLVAYAIYRHAAGDDAWSLVLTGHEDARLQRLKQIARSLRIESDVIFAGYIPEHELVGCYHQAGALVFPSLHEGFGIPLIEAMAFDLPILASDATAIPEITGSAALRVNPREPAALAAALQCMAGDSKLRASLVERGRTQLANFVPEIEFNRLLEAIVNSARNCARWRRSGYYPIDGLIDPIAIFALPPAEGEVTLTLALRPLGVARTLQIACGNELLAQRQIPASQSHHLTLTFLPRGRAVTLRVPDASSLSTTDPRIHGVLLDTLKLLTSDGRSHDLLAVEPG